MLNVRTIYCNGTARDGVIPKKQVTRWRYDTRGKLTAKTYPDKSTELYEHDLAGQMTRRIRPDGTTATYTYNDRSRLLSIVWSDGKTEPSTFAYDAAGHMTLAKNNSATITRAYNESGKLAQESSTVAPQLLSNTGFQPDLTSPFQSVVGYEYTPEGRLARLHYPDATTVAYEYNARGELAHVIDTAADAKPATFTYTRRPDGKITQIDLPNGAKTTKTYDAVGRLETIAHLDNNNKILESETSRYDLRNRRTARMHADGSTDLFAYDPAGQVTAAAYGQAKVASASAEPPATKNEEPGTKNFTPTQTFAYDPAGNRTSVTDAGMTTNYQTNEANQYTRIESSGSAPSVDQAVIVEPTFDKLGNLLQDDRNTYTWDADIHLLSVTTKSKDQPGTKNQAQRTDFKYDALHRRVARIEPHQTTLFVMDAWNVIQEHQSGTGLQPVNHPSSIAANPSPSRPSSGSPSLSARHTWGEDLSGSLQGAGGIGGLLSSTHNTSKAKNEEPGTKNLSLFFHYDSNGNVVLLTDAMAHESARYSYDAYGKTKTAAGIASEFNQYRFSTKPVEVSSGLAYYGYRYYAPELGRWTAMDPVGESAGTNRIVVVSNSMVGTVDYLGQCGCYFPTVYDSMAPAAGNLLDDSVACARRIEQEVHGAWNTTEVAETDPRSSQAHCIASCRISRECTGSLVASAAAGLYREYCAPSWDTLFDIASNAVGIAGSAMLNMTCEEGCVDLNLVW